MPSITFYIYGSRARGDHRPDSDVDVFVYTDDACMTDLVTVQSDDGPPEKYAHIRDQAKEWPELQSQIRSAREVYRRENVVCVFLPDGRRASN